MELKEATSLETMPSATSIARRRVKRDPDSLAFKAPSVTASPSRKKGKATILKVTLDWSAVGRGGGQEVIEDPKAVSTFVKTLAKIAKQVGNEKFSRLQDLRVNRGSLLSPGRTRYHFKEVAGYYVLTYNSTSEKAEILREVVEELRISKGFLNVEVVGS